MTEPRGAKQVYRVFVRAPIERVWAELVDCNSPRPFFYDALCDTPGLEPGAPYRMVSRDRKFAFVVGEVLEFDPPHRYAQTFRFTTEDDAPCKVTYLLEEVEGGVQFSLITENVPAGTRTEKSMDTGGKWITRNFKAVVETGRPTTGARLMLWLMSVFSALAPKKARIENWPLDRCH